MQLIIESTETRFMCDYMFQQFRLLMCQILERISDFMTLDSENRKEDFRPMAKCSRQFLQYVYNFALVCIVTFLSRDAVLAL